MISARMMFRALLVAAAVLIWTQAAIVAQPPDDAPTSEEEAALLPYYNNYLREYHLGPEDVISVDVFGEPKYSKTGIVIPPTARISYPLIAGGVFVGGKTTEQIADEIKKRLNEYIIDPQVTVTLDKVGSARFGVLGKVGTPGVKVMNRRYNVYEAIAEAGGIAKDGDSKRVLLLRLTPEGGFSQTIIDMSDITKGKEPVPYLLPGDQLIVPEKRWSLTKILDVVGRASAIRILFGSPF
ncbi:MAG: polysaccharide biosynthesis/export family protein [Pyrinomonadaceae bacterium]